MSGEGHSAEKDAAKRGHVLTVTKGEDWFPDQPDWDGSITCLNVDRCGGWWECGKPHEINGVSAADGPYENDCPGEHGVSTDRAGHLPWCNEDEFEFHGVLHTWRWGYGWTVPYSGCVVQTSDAVSDAAYDIGQQHGEGSYLVDDEWDDTSCTLIYAERVLPPEVSDRVNTPAFTHLAAALVAENDEPPVDVERLAVLVSGDRGRVSE